MVWTSLFILIPTLLPAAPLSEALDPIVARAKLKPETFGIEVASLASGASLYSKNGGASLNPASNIKILITAAALSRLGPAHRFETVVSGNGNDVCLVGGGDPSLVNETMWMLVEEARRNGLKEISGNLILDSSLFPAARESVEDFEGDQDRAFTAPVAPLSVNFNSITIHIDPTELKSRPLVQLEPELPSFEIRNRAVTAAAGGKRDINASVEFKGEKGIVEIGGHISSRHGRLTIYRSVPAPDLYAGAVFLEHLRRAGGSFKGKVIRGKCPAEAREIVRFQSKPLSEIISGLNKWSNNFIAEMLLRAVGSEPTPESGLKAIREWLASASIAAPELVMENASGLSKRTRISPKTLTAVLVKAANDFRLGPEYLSSLSILGVDGTLRKWLRESDAKASVRAKSGMLSDAVALSGLADTASHGRVAFSFIFQASKGEHYALMQLEQQLLQALVK
jgi:D-alanyl-D-alanine carboxypeptidase/D-alanyl-D-alanine-endopeptidase (penicillin-binding protein 4)